MLLSVFFFNRGHFDLALIHGLHRSCSFAGTKFSPSSGWTKEKKSNLKSIMLELMLFDLCKHAHIQISEGCCAHS